MKSYSYVGWVEVQPENKLTTFHENWQTDMYPLDLKDHTQPGRMGRAIFNHCNVIPGNMDLPAPGFYLVKARGLLEFGCDADGGTVHLTIDRASYGPAEQHQMRDWFINPVPRRPIYLKATIQDEPK